MQLPLGAAGSSMTAQILGKVRDWMKSSGLHHLPRVSCALMLQSLQSPCARAELMHVRVLMASASKHSPQSSHQFDM